ncbi:hypothetical protein PCE1_002486 [Barthelona sp. PCE]
MSKPKTFYAKHVSNTGKFDASNGWINYDNEKIAIKREQEEKVRNAELEQMRDNWLSHKRNETLQKFAKTQSQRLQLTHSSLQQTDFNTAELDALEKERERDEYKNLQTMVETMTDIENFEVRLKTMYNFDGDLMIDSDDDY